MAAGSGDTASKYVARRETHGEGGHGAERDGRWEEDHARRHERAAHLAAEADLAVHLEGRPILQTRLEKGRHVLEAPMPTPDTAWLIEVTLP